MQIYNKPVRLLMKEMLDKFALGPGESFSKQQVLDWFKSNYPKIKTSTIEAHLAKLSTNVPRRIHYNLHPGDDDLFFRINPNCFRAYDAKHDEAPIHTAVKPVVKAHDGKVPDEDEELGQTEQFAYEKDLQNYLAKNLSKIEGGLKLYEEEGITGIEVDADGRFIDILAVSAVGDFVVIELKVSRGYEKVVGQLLRYIAWVRKELAKPEQKVRGVIVAREISADLRLACSELQNVRLFEYEMSVSLKPVDLM
jgi:hypothetical protein